MQSEQTFEEWFAELRRLASQRDLQWMIGAEADSYRASFDRGLSPEEELDALEDFAQWRGCGCGR